MWSFHWWFWIVKFWVKWRSVKECKLASADLHLQVCILSQRELTNLDKNLWAIIWPEKVILKEWQQEQQQTAKTTTIVSLRYRKKTKYCLSNLRKAVFSDGIWDFFFSKNGHFLVLYGSVLFLTSPTVQCLCKMVLVRVMVHFSSSLIFSSSSFIFFYFWWLLLTGGDWLRGSVKRFEIPLLTLAPPGGVEVRYSKLGWSEMGWIMLHYVRAQTASFWRSTFLGKI